MNSQDLFCNGIAEKMWSSKTFFKDEQPCQLGFSISSFERNNGERQCSSTLEICYNWKGLPDSKVWKKYFKKSKIYWQR